MATNLNTIGSKLFKSGAVNLADTIENGYTRTHAATGYRRINPFEVNAGRAPSEQVAPHTLGDWSNSYQHSTLNTGSDLEVDGGYRAVTALWVKPTGYISSAGLDQRVYWKDMGTSEDLSVNPFSSPTGSASAGDGTSYEITGLTAGNYYAVGVKCEWDDSVVTHENPDSSAYDTKAGETPLLGAGRGVSTGEIWDDSPTIDSVVQLTDPGTCLVGCQDCVDIKLNITMNGTSAGTLQEQVGGGGWNTIDSNVPAGTSSITLVDKDDATALDYRMKYNDVSPETWSNTGSITTECTLL